MGELAAINEVQQYAVVGIMQALIIALLGINVVRVIWFPVLYLLFLVPTGEYLIVPMQQFATHFVDVSLNLLGIPHYTEGTIFELTNGRFEIAEACAGLRFLIATVTLGVLFSYMMFRKIYKIALFLIACVAVPLIGNGLRCVGIILLAHFTNNRIWRRRRPHRLWLGLQCRHPAGAGRCWAPCSATKFRRQDRPFGPDRRAPAARLAAGCGSGGRVGDAGPALAWWHDNYSHRPIMTAIANPFANHGPGMQRAAPASWQPEFSGARRPGGAAMAPAAAVARPVDLYLGYYARPAPAIP